MPKLVDRDARRREILEVTWRLMATRGPEAATMREIARAAGYANGALTHYFANKEALIEAAFVYVFDRTNERIGAAVEGKRGLAALRAFLIEVVPATGLTVLEARIVLPFWSRAVTDERLALISDEAMKTWRKAIQGLLEKAREDGDVTVETTNEILAEQLLAMAMGLQVLGLLPDAPTPAATQLEMVDNFLDQLRP